MPEQRKQEFRNRTKAFASFLGDDCAIRSDKLDRLLQESDELIAILVTMSKNVKAASTTSKFQVSGLRSQVSSFIPQPFPPMFDVRRSPRTFGGKNPLTR